MTGSINAFVPIAKNFAVSGAYRTNLRDISNNSFYSLNKFNPPKLVENIPGQRFSEVLLRSSPTFKFYDGNFKLDYQYKYGDLSASFCSVNDDFTNTITQNQKFDFRPQTPTILSSKTNNDRIWNSTGYGLVKRFYFSEKFSSIAKWYRSSYQEDYELKTLVGSRTEFNRLTNETNFGTSLTVQELSLSAAYKVSKLYELSAGIANTRLENNANYLSTRIKQYSENQNTTYPSFFMQFKKLETEKISFGGGLKINQINNQRIIDGNIQYQNKVSDNSALKLAFNRSNQNMRRINIEIFLIKV
ncbi:MAG: hypothetical protein IPN72_22545 [Saprospiraceae bacterium]|nr:hypothetical protein [Saprospiraceae bacterium]